jgi:hypothetical protein
MVRLMGLVEPQREVLRPVQQLPRGFGHPCRSKCSGGFPA